MHNHKAARKSLRQSESSNTYAEDESISIMLIAVVLVFGFCYSFEFTRRILN